MIYSPALLGALHVLGLLFWGFSTAETGVTLTEHFAMFPAAAVSGWYFAHPESKYFGVGKIGRDQVESIAERKAWDMKTAERWLQPNLDY